MVAPGPVHGQNLSWIFTMAGNPSGFISRKKDEYSKVQTVCQ